MTIYLPTDRANEVDYVTPPTFPAEAHAVCALVNGGHNPGDPYDPFGHAYGKQGEDMFIPWGASYLATDSPGGITAHRGLVDMGLAGMTGDPVPGRIIVSFEFSQPYTAYAPW